MSILYVGLDVHKDSIPAAVFGPTGTEALRLEKLPNDTHRIRRFFERLAKDGSELRACYEASAAGYVLHRLLTSWGIGCDVIAPSLLPTRAGEKRKHDKRDALQLGRLYHAGELVAVRIPSEAEERVRDLVPAGSTVEAASPAPLLRCAIDMPFRSNAQAHRRRAARKLVNATALKHTPGAENIRGPASACSALVRLERCPAALLPH